MSDIAPPDPAASGLARTDPVPSGSTRSDAAPRPRTGDIARSLSWSALIVYANRALGLVTLLLLAKLLDPRDFGIVAVASIIIEVLRISKDMGIGEALIYQKDESPDTLDTAHTILLTYSLALFAAAAVIAPFAARYYDNWLITPVVIIMASNLVWDATRGVARTIYRRRLDFRGLVIPEVVPMAIASVVSVVMAWLGFGVWSLVVRTVLHSILGAVLLRLRGLYQPRLRFRRESARALFGYGRYIVGSSVLFVALYNIDKFYVSTALGLAALGMYELAVRISDLPVKEVSHVIGSVMFPVFARLDRDGRGGLQAAFLKTLRYTTLVTAPLAIGLATFGPMLLLRIYGERWAAAAEALGILALYTLFRAMSSLVHDMFKAIGRPQLMQRFTFVRLVCIGVLGIPVLREWGLVGLCALVLVTYAGAFVGEMIMAARLIEAPLMPTLLATARPAIIAGVVMPGTLAALHAVSRPPGLGLLAAGIAAAVAVYAAAVYALERRAIGELRRALLPRAS
jgi:O-antigen/teichoic acid export membrane protein